MQILLIDNNIMQDSWGAPDLRGVATRVPGATVTVRRAPQEDLPRDLGRYDRVVISGSKTAATNQAPWVDRLEEAIRFFIERGTPVLGVCYGHQMIARALGGIRCVSRSATPEVGWTRIEVLERSPIFEGLPREFHSFSVHLDEVCELPRGLRHIARSSECRYQAFELEGKPVFGIQFHPERSLEEGEETLLKRKKSGANVLGAGQGHKLFDQAVGEKIFGNFFKL